MTVPHDRKVELLRFVVDAGALQVPLTPRNESILRELAMRYWVSTRDRRKEHPTRAGKPLTDLSGACMLVSQLASVVFPLNGMVVSNRKHSFFRFPDGTVYDMNRNCEDVRKMHASNYGPYLIDYNYTMSDKALQRLSSWNKGVRELAKEYLDSFDLDRSDNDRERRVNTCPSWANPKAPASVRLKKTKPAYKYRHPLNNKELRP